MSHPRPLRRQSSTIPRRRFLQLVGTSPLWSMLGTRALAAGVNTPKRLVIWFMPEGTEAPFFWPKQTGPLSINMDTALVGTQSPNVNTHETWLLQPLRAHESRITLVRGINVDWRGGRHPEYHEAVMEGMLSGFGPDSIDEIVGPEIQGSAPFSALRMGVFGWTQTSPHYDRLLFMRNGNQVEANWNPASVYDTVFPVGIPTGQDSSTTPLAAANAARRGFRSRLALLGSVGRQLREIECAGGVDARARMENYLDSLERVENETQVLLSDIEDPEPTASPPSLSVELPSNAHSTAFWRNELKLREMGRLMMDVAVASLALDRTRMLCMQWSATGLGGHAGYDFITAETKGGGDHRLAHNKSGGSDSELPSGVAMRDRARIFRWYYSQLNYFLDRLAAIPEGDGTMLDNTIVATISEAAGMDHRLDDLPALIVAPPGGPLVTGKYLSLPGGGRWHHDYVLTLAKAMGSSVGNIGRGDRVISDIMA